MPSKQITVRFSHSVVEMIERKCGELGCDTSFVIRKAVEGFLEVNGDDPTQGKPCASLVFPTELLGHTSQYLAFSGNLRQEVQRQFIELLAAVYVAARHFPKTEWIMELYATMLAVSKYINLEQSVRQTPNATFFRQFQGMAWDEDA